MFRIKIGFKRLAAWTLPVLLLSPVLFIAPVLSMPGKSFIGPLPPLLEAEKQLSHSLRSHVEALASDIGDRHLYKPGKLSESVSYIKATLSQWYGKVESQQFEFEGQLFENVIAECPGAKKPDEIIVLGAHYDSVQDCPGANDNGSGVAAVLELARLFHEHKPERTIRFVFFPNEEFFFNTEGMGSYQYADLCKHRGDKIKAMLSLETIGYYNESKGSQKYPPGLGFFYPKQGDFIAFVGTSGSRSAIKRMVKAFRKSAQFPSEALSAPAFIPGVDWSDHQAFARLGYPAFMVTDTAPYRYPYYHTPEDTVDKIDFDRTARVVYGLYRALPLF